MSTTATLNAAISHVRRLVPNKDLFDSIYVRAATLNQTTGRCTFDFSANQTKSNIAVCVALDGRENPIGFYVIPMNRCPSILLVKPGAENSKYHPYYCDKADSLSDFIQKMAEYQPSKSLLRRLA